MTKKLVVWGASGHALVVADALRAAGGWEIAGFLDDVSPDRRGEEFAGATVLGGREVLADLRRQGVEDVIVAVGDNAARTRLARLAQAEGFRLATVVHPRATVAPDVALGAGTVVAAGAVVNPGARIGENVIVNTSASVDHECVVEDGAHIGPGARLGGRVSVGPLAWIGIGATVRDGVSIGARSVIGAGAVVLNDIPPGVIAYGVPAKVVRTLEPDAEPAPANPKARRP